ncbi:MAG: DUF1674 domain-containing protein [Microvirga sp.]|nr:DUF1674 domain-containing protein [Microvirga sp.]
MTPAQPPEAHPTIEATIEATASPEVPGAAPGKTLSDAARRALDEAQARRTEIDARAAEIASKPERLGRGGLEPVRYTDWEIKGIASDF